MYDESRSNIDESAFVQVRIMEKTNCQQLSDLRRGRGIGMKKMIGSESTKRRDEDTKILILSTSSRRDLVE